MANPKELTPEQLQSFIERLSNHPELYEQFRRILDLSDPAAGGHGLDVNRMERMLRPEIRKTGKVAISEFARQVECESASVAREQGMVQREKKR